MKELDALGYVRQRSSRDFFKNIESSCTYIPSLVSILKAAELEI
jgi:hypothetical protein